MRYYHFPLTKEPLLKGLRDVRTTASISLNNKGVKDKAGFIRKSNKFLLGAIDLYAPFAGDPYALFFDSSDPDHPLSRFSYICPFPIETIESNDGRVVVTNPNHQYVFSGNPFDVLKDRIDAYQATIQNMPKASKSLFTKHKKQMGFGEKAASSRRQSVAFFPQLKNASTGQLDKGQSGKGQAALHDTENYTAMDMGQGSSPVEFLGGAAGYFGYDMGRSLEQLPVRAQKIPDVPDMAIGIYTSVIAYDHHYNKAALHILSDSREAALKTKDLILDKIADYYEDVASKTALEYGAINADESSLELNFKPQKSAAAFQADIQKVIDYIYAGDIFQANLSLQFQAERPEDFDCFKHYRQMRALNKAPFGAYMNFDQPHFLKHSRADKKNNYQSFKIASVSPERFIAYNQGEVVTSPIKGTCPRHKDPDQDRKAMKDLQANEKCRAENAMIVDLMRNDLSRVCQDFSIHVTDLCQVESYAHVHHLVSNVVGQLRADHDAVDLLKSCFPGGSITGAPKIRAMEIIEELEPNRRGPYCGSIGFIGFDGNMVTNIAIRTVIHAQEKSYFNVGSGIVADSSAREEYDEIMAKASGVLSSFSAQKGKTQEFMAHHDQSYGTGHYNDNTPSHLSKHPLRKGKVI